MYTFQNSIPSSENSADPDYLASVKIGNLFSSILIIELHHLNGRISKLYIASKITCCVFIKLNMVYLWGKNFKFPKYTVR